MSKRGTASGVIGSLAVLAIAAIALGVGRAAAEGEPQRPTTRVRATPALRPASTPAALQPLWLRRLLSPRDLPVEAPHGKG